MLWTKPNQPTTSSSKTSFHVRLGGHVHEIIPFHAFPWHGTNGVPEPVTIGRTSSIMKIKDGIIITVYGRVELVISWTLSLIGWTVFADSRNDPCVAGASVHDDMEGLIVLTNKYLCVN
mgnify:CR=1 FL=1